MSSILQRIADAGLGITFVVLGYQAAAEPGGRVAAAAEFGLPNPQLAVRLNGGAMALGGAALVVGVRQRAAALGLIASLVPTTLAGHPFWNESDPKVRANHLAQVLKNLGLMSGLLGIIARR